MKIPDKIYLREFKGAGLAQVWSAIKPTEKTIVASHEYIHKDTLMEWLQKEYDTNKWFYDTHAKPNNLHIGKCEAYKQVIDKIESL